MNYVSRENIQLGKTGWVFRELSNVLAGAMCVDIYCCPKCPSCNYDYYEE